MYQRIERDVDLIYSYLAGAIDSDGYISILKAARRRGKSSEHRPLPDQYTLRIGLSQTNPMIPELLRSTFGGSLWSHQPRNPRHKRSFAWSAMSTVGAAAIFQLLPHLRLKTEQGELALEFDQLKKEQWAEMKREQVPPYQVTPAMLEGRERLYEAVISLNSPRNRRVHLNGVLHG